MKRRTIIGIIVAYVAVMIGVYATLLHGRTVSLFETQGTIADQQKNLMYFTIALGFLIVIPVIVMTFAIAWRYRESNTKATYHPEWGGSWIAESIWWVVPTVIIAILSVVIVQSSHALDPYKKLEGGVKPVKVQVVALPWRWLFIYPDEKVASINYFKFPVNTPVNFTITSDAAMNSFWIPQLGGQIYAMSGMSAQLSLAAHKTGDYRGSSANISGLGFSGMKFTASSVSQDDYQTWVNLLRGGGDPLDLKKYEAIAKKSCDSTQYSYSLAERNLYNEVISKYMDPNATLKEEKVVDASSAPENCVQKTIPESITSKLLGKN